MIELLLFCRFIIEILSFTLRNVPSAEYGTMAVESDEEEVEAEIEIEFSVWGVLTIEVEVEVEVGFLSCRLSLAAALELLERFFVAAAAAEAVAVAAVV